MLVGTNFKILYVFYLIWPYCINFSFTEKEGEILKTEEKKKKFSETKEAFSHRGYILLVAGFLCAVSNNFNLYTYSRLYAR